MNYGAKKLSVDATLAKFGVRVEFTKTSMQGVVTKVEGAVLREGTVTHLYGNETNGVQIGDAKLIVSADVDPRAGDRFTLAGEKLVIVGSVDPIRPADVTLCFRCFGRRG